MVSEQTPTPTCAARRRRPRAAVAGRRGPQRLLAAHQQQRRALAARPGHGDGAHLADGAHPGGADGAGHAHGPAAAGRAGPGTGPLQHPAHADLLQRQGRSGRPRRRAGPVEPAGTPGGQPAGAGRAATWTTCRCSAGARCPSPASTSPCSATKGWAARASRCWRRRRPRWPYGPRCCGPARSRWTTPPTTSCGSRPACLRPAAELTEQVNPLEAGLRRFCDDHKGCYTGQEIIARQITYDKVTTHLVGLLPEDLVAPEAKVMAEGTPGRLGQQRRPQHRPGSPHRPGLRAPPAPRTRHAACRPVWRPGDCCNGPALPFAVEPEIPAFCRELRRNWANCRSSSLPIQIRSIRRNSRPTRPSPCKNQSSYAQPSPTS